MEILIAAGATFAFLAIFFFGRTVRCSRHGRLLRAGGSCISCLASLTLAAAAGSLLFSYVSYSRLTAEQVVGKLEFKRTGTDEYNARLMVTGKKDQVFELRGDEWQIDARVVNWTPPATILGLDPIYKLERLSGRYSTIERERNEARTVHALNEPLAIDVWRLAHRFPVLMPGVDAYYGTATYVPMADGARYTVSLSRDAIIARPDNDAARHALGNWEAQNP